VIHRFGMARYGAQDQRLPAEKAWSNGLQPGWFASIGSINGLQRIKQYYVESRGPGSLEFKYGSVRYDLIGSGGEWRFSDYGAREKAGMSVIFANGEEKVVPAYMLDYLISENKIIAFLRSDGWVQLDRDPIRKSQQSLRKPGDRWSDFMFKRSLS